jgi:hypothetical protein
VDTVEIVTRIPTNQNRSRTAAAVVVVGTINSHHHNDGSIETIRIVKVYRIGDRNGRGQRNATGHQRRVVAAIKIHVNLIIATSDETIIGIEQIQIAGIVGIGTTEIEISQDLHMRIGMVGGGVEVAEEEEAVVSIEIVMTMIG